MQIHLRNSCTEKKLFLSNYLIFLCLPKNCPEVDLWFSSHVSSHVISRHTFVVVCQKENVMSNWRLEITVSMMDYQKYLVLRKPTTHIIWRQFWNCCFELYAISNVYLSSFAAHKLDSFFKFNWTIWVTWEIT